MSEETSLVPHESPAEPESLALYRAPRIGGSARSRMRTMVLISGSVGIGIGAALGVIGLPAAAVLALGLASGQVLAQAMHQNRLGQDVMGGIAGGDLPRALKAAEKALQESPSGAMRTLASANLASVLMQMDRLEEGIEVLDAHRPTWLQVPTSSVLWLNNRAFGALVMHHQAELAGALLDEAESKLKKVGPRGFGGAHNQRKIASAVAGTRALQCLDAGNAREALAQLDYAYTLDDGMGSSFRTAERELCRAESLRRLGRRDESLLTVAALADKATTERQAQRLDLLEERLGVPSTRAQRDAAQRRKEEEDAGHERDGFLA
ncbi:MAG: tetratricopeptide repeat protein [Deltaproteobacteria bacterium]|nr:tetratricopeptide repeat protein [Deltaproteobacteria bacterium]